MSEPAKKYQRQRAWRERNPKAYWAHQCLRSAVKRGLLVQKSCETCGDPESEAHHDNYDMPMAVRWLCRRHHKAEHRRIRQTGGG